MKFFAAVAALLVAGAAAQSEISSGVSGASSILSSLTASASDISESIASSSLSQISSSAASQASSLSSVLSSQIFSLSSRVNSATATQSGDQPDETGAAYLTSANGVIVGVAAGLVAALV